MLWTAIACMVVYMWGLHQCEIVIAPPHDIMAVGLGKLRWLSARLLFQRRLQRPFSSTSSGAVGQMFPFHLVLSPSPGISHMVPAVKAPQALVTISFSSPASLPRSFAASPGRTQLLFPKLFFPYTAKRNLSKGQSRKVAKRRLVALLFLAFSH